jgi:hypothetical protein
MSTRVSGRRVTKFALRLMLVAGLAVAATALVWAPEAHSRDVPFGDTTPCARGLEMWVWGVSSDGSSGHGPRGGGEQQTDPVWDAECLEHLATIQIITVGALSAAVVGIGGLVAIAISDRRAARRRGELTRISGREVREIALVLLVAAGFAVAATALVWVPEARVATFSEDNYTYTDPCAPGWEMWVWGVGPWPGSGGLQTDLLWEKECSEHLATIQIITVTALSAAVLGIGGLVAAGKSERRVARSRDGSPTSA